MKHSHDVSNIFLTRLKKSLPTAYHKQIDNCLQLRIYDESSTEHKRLQHFKNTGHFIRPVSVKLGTKPYEKKEGENTVKTFKQCSAYSVPLGNVLKMFLELPNVFKEIREFIQRETAQEKGIYTSVYTGDVWREISKHFDGKIVIGLDFHFDDFEVVDPLGAAKGIYKIGGLYFSISGLPAKYAAWIENIFVAQLIYTSDLKKFKAPRCFAHIVDQIEALWENGISITVEGQIFTVHFVVLSIPGDNLGINCLFGFTESFSAHYYCRFCHVIKADAGYLCYEKKDLLRTLDSYERDLKLKQRGICNVCIFNDMPFFHNIFNWCCHIMHDFLL